MSKYGFTNLHFAAMTGQSKVVELTLEQENYKIMKENIKNDFGMLPLHYAAEKGHTYVFKALLEIAKEHNTKVNHGETLLRLAAGNGHLSIVNIILGNIDARNSNGKLPLRRASLETSVRQGYSEIWR